MFKKILLTLDGSALAERAIDPALAMGKMAGAVVLLLRVVPALSEKVPEAGPTEEYKEFSETVAHATAYLENVASRFAAESVKTRIMVPAGSPYSEILRAAHNEDVDFIVMTTHGGTALERALLGSTTEQVMLRTKRPVFLVKPERIRAAHHLDETEVFVSAEK
jgi:nucleotide-binding universal stress UspA family protein